MREKELEKREELGIEQGIEKTANKKNIYNERWRKKGEREREVGGRERERGRELK